MPYRFGDLTVHAVVEQRSEAPAANIFPDLHPGLVADLVRDHRDWLVGPHLDEAGNRRGAIRTWVIRDGARTIVVDTCVGNHKHRAGTGFDRWHHLDLPFLDNLAAVGVQPEAVDLAICTHLHVDHVGWNTRWDGAAWVPTFPNARYVWVEEEWYHWRAAADPMTELLRSDSLQPVVDAGLVDLVPCDHRITDHLRFEDTRGHTPAHAAVRLTDPSGATPGAVFSGDLMHSPLQLVLPALEVVYDVDRAGAIRARHDFLDRYAGSRVLMFSAHFGGDGAGFVERHGSAHRFAMVGEPG
jgi:glyoxylase-like metal-dependent hydrolase (beta-lactamase superfamily II)